MLRSIPKRMLATLTLAVLLTLPLLSQISKNRFDSKSAHTKTEAANSENKIDLNTASKLELESLPGIGATSAKKIIAARPYSTVSDLSKAGIPPKTIQKISGLVIVNGATSTPAPPSNVSAMPTTAAPEANPSTSSGDSGKIPPIQKASSAKDNIAQSPPHKGMVWVNLDSGIYHKEGARWYGKTKNGKFMDEADAIKAGYRSAKN